MDSQKNIISIEDIENIIVTRLNPHIYAFSTDTLPKYLKIGDTLRGVDTRINEWRRKIAEKLHVESVKLTEEYRRSALLSNDIYFRDYSVHEYLQKIGKSRLPEELKKLYSDEFFADTDVQDVEAAIQNIIDDFGSGNLDKIYQYYSVKENKSTTLHGANDKDWKLRPNQEEVVKSFMEKSAERELLMYAVMRFGKSLTAMSCAVATNAKKVLIVSAKADVEIEWQKTVETPKCFKDYIFLTDADLASGATIDEYLSKSEKNRVALFLTLQNLTGKPTDRSVEGENVGRTVSDQTVKRRLEQVFEQEFDLVIVDETHYGAWANTYGEPLKDADEDVIKEERKDYKNFTERVAKLHYKKKLHLSGTPYNLLYENKFNSDNIIATCQFKDILREKAKWDEDNFYKIENGETNPDTGAPYQEYDNPYFGFPQMLRFAFNLPISTRQTLEKAKYNWTLNDLFETTVVDGVAAFVHEQGVLDLLKAVDGSKQADGILSFLDIPKIKDNDVCKHMVFALPRKYACDAMEALLLNHAEEFINLRNYEVLNITGHTLKSDLDSVDKVKARISQCEKSNPPIKTITLTVYKMLTGVTVEEWDTFFMLKDTHSAQEYDQAVFRVQNQFVEEHQSQDGSIMKIDKKPQTILVDFDPVRMFTLQGLSSRIIEHVKRDEATLSESIDEALNFFPIITYNADKLVKVEATDLIELITQYNNNKSIMDSVQAVVFDKGLSDQFLLQYIKNQSPTSAKNSLDAPAHESEEDSDIQTPQPESDEDPASENENGGNSSNTQDSDGDSEDKDLEKKYRMCIARLAFYSFLTETNIDGLQDIIDSLKETCQYYEDNIRIFQNLELNYEFIVGLQAHLSHFYALSVDDALKRANLLSKDEKLSPEERALNAIKNFNRFSESEVVTPNHVCNEMVNCIGKEQLVAILQNGDKILDIAGKAGEFAFAVYKLLNGRVNDEVLQNGIYTIPTSGTAYEFTKRIYKVLGLNQNNIANPQKLTSYKLLDIKTRIRRNEVIDYAKIKIILTQNKKFCEIAWNDEITEGATDMINFGAVVGNPPYQEESKTESLNNRQSPRTNIFHHFQLIAMALSTANTALIYPGKRWLHQSGKGLAQFGIEFINNPKLDKIIFYPDANELFGKIEISDGITIVKTDIRKKNEGFDYEYHFGNVKRNLFRKNPGKELLVLDPLEINIAEKIKAFVKENNLSFLHDAIYSRSLFGIESDFIEKNKDKVVSFEEGMEIDYSKKVKLLTNDKSGPGGRTTWFVVDKDVITQNAEYISQWQVVVSSAHPGGQEGRENQISIVDNHSAFGRSRLALKSFMTKTEAENFFKYATCSFIKYTFLLADESLSSLAKYVPDIIDYTNESKILNFSCSTDELSKQLYDKCHFTPDEIAFIESMIKSME